MRRSLGVVAFLCGLVACQSATAPSLVELEQAQAQWASHHLTRYAYRYVTHGFFNAFDGQTIRLVVIADTVRSAQFVSTNDSVPAAADVFPTIDDLFSTAIAARQAGTLTAATFDSAFGFPTSLSISGPPDASGVISASAIEPLP